MVTNRFFPSCCFLENTSANSKKWAGFPNQVFDMCGHFEAFLEMFGESSHHGVWVEHSRRSEARSGEAANRNPMRMLLMEGLRNGGNHIGLSEHWKDSRDAKLGLQ